jgi:hypothetical protein
LSAVLVGKVVEDGGIAHFRVPIGDCGNSQANVIAKGAGKIMWWAKVKVAAVAFVALLGLGGVARWSGSLADAAGTSATTRVSAAAGLPTTQDSLAIVVRQNGAARQKIQSYSYHIELESQPASRDGKATPVIKGTADVKRKGEYLWCVYSYPALNVTLGQWVNREMRIVVNDRYVACWPMRGNPLAYQYLHSSFDTINPDVQDKIDVFTPRDVTKHAFGDESFCFSDEIAHFPAMKWDAIETKDGDGQVVYQIRRFMPTMDDISKPDSIWVVDPRKGFLANESIAYKRNGDIWIHRFMRSSEVASGIWFPVEYDEKYYGEDDRSPSKTDEVTSWRRAKLTDVKVNVEFAKEQFEIDALHLKEDWPDIIVVRTELDGRKVPYVYWKDALVPRPRRFARSM